MIVVLLRDTSSGYGGNKINTCRHQPNRIWGTLFSDRFTARLFHTIPVVSLKVMGAVVNKGERGRGVAETVDQR